MLDRPLFLIHVSVAVTDDRGRLLLVQEEKPALHGRWNLPGGHLEHDEPVLLGAARELREETHLDSPLDGLVGIYSTFGPKQYPAAIRLVFRCHVGNQQPRPGDEILAVRFVTADELEQMPGASLVSPAMLRSIIRDLPHARAMEPHLFFHQHATGQVVRS